MLCPSHPLAATDKMRMNIQDFVILVGKEAPVIWVLGQLTQEAVFQNILKSKSESSGVKYCLE